MPPIWTQAIRYQISTKSVTHISNLKEIKQTEETTVINILQKKEYNTNLLEKPLSQTQKQSIHEESKHQKTKWDTFTYSGKEVKK
jgi:hypothetical protein